MIERFREADDALRPTPEQVVSLMQHWAELEVVQRYRAGRIRDALVKAAAIASDGNEYISQGIDEITEIDPSIPPLLAALQNDLTALEGWHISWLEEGDEDNQDAVRRAGWLIGGEAGLASWRVGEIVSMVNINDGHPERESGVMTFLWNMRDIVITPPTE